MACLRLRGRRALVVGGGATALGKVEGLLACGAEVMLVAPEAEPTLRELAAKRVVTWRERVYRPDDLDGCLLVIAASGDRELDRCVFEDAEGRAMLVNVPDAPTLCTFILPAIARNGPLAVAISTAGASPALAKRMRREAARLFGKPYADLALLLGELRGWAKRTLPTYTDRKEFFESIVNGEPDPIELLRAGESHGVEALIAAAQDSHRPA